MTTPFKNFDKLPEVDNTPTCEFELGGKRWHVRNVSQLPWVDIDKMPKKVTGEDVRDYVFALLERFIVPEEGEAFSALIRSSRSPLSKSNAMPLLAWITEQVTERPTEQSSSSEGGLPSTAPKSPAARSSAATRTRKRR